MNPSGWDAVILGLHVTAAATWVGGSIALGVVALVLRREAPDDPARASGRIAELARGLNWVLWPAMLIAVATGFYNLSWYLPPGVPLSQLPQAPYLLAKLATVAALLVVSGGHSFVLGPWVRRRRASGRPTGRLSQLDAALGALSTVLGIVVLVLAAQLERF